MMSGFIPGSAMILFWILIILAIAFLVRTLKGQEDTAAEPDARGILDERFARGEIDHREYQERKRTLKR